MHWYKYKQDFAIDPYFGLDLYLQVNIKENVFWVYNIDHLKYLRHYVSSTLREGYGRHKYSLITNLPQWIKAAKNRELIVKKLDFLGNKCKNLN